MIKYMKIIEFTYLIKNRDSKHFNNLRINYRHMHLEHERSRKQKTYITRLF